MLDRAQCVYSYNYWTSYWREEYTKNLKNSEQTHATETTSKPSCFWWDDVNSYAKCKQKLTFLGLLHKSFLKDITPRYFLRISHIVKIFLFIGIIYMMCKISLTAR